MLNSHPTVEQSLNRLSISNNVISLPTRQYSKTSSHGSTHHKGDTLIDRIATSLQRAKATDHRIHRHRMLSDQ